MHRIGGLCKNPHLATGKATRDRRPGSLDPTTLLGDIIGQTEVGFTATQMKLALDGGQQIHARVLSGVGYGTIPDVPPDPSPHYPCTRYPCPLHDPPPEEHSLVIIGWDHDTFVFADPDAGASHTPDAGFGLLFFDYTGDRLSTAQNHSDLYVTSNGHHKSTGQRETPDKRYQVINLTSFS